MTFTYAVSNVEASPGPTPWQTVGPFFHHALPYEAGSAVAGAAVPDRVRLFGAVYDGQGEPILDALVEIWQADANGAFVTSPGVYAASGGFRGFGRSATDGGEYEFFTIKPGPVATVDGRTQAPHVAMSVFSRGMLRRVITRVYFPGDAHATDPFLQSLPAPRRATLVALAAADGYRFDVYLQGDRETVFLDVSHR